MSFEKGNQLYNNGKYKQAINEYIESIKNYEEVESCYYNMAVSYMKLKEYDDGIECLKNAISYNRKSKYFYNLGCCYYNKKDLGSAMFNLIIAYGLDDEDEDIRDAIDIISKVISSENDERENK